MLASTASPSSSAVTHDEADATVLAVIEVGEAVVSIFLDRSPFYAESGGQIGDTGTITGPTGSAEVTDTTAVAPGLHRSPRQAHRRNDRGRRHGAAASIDVARRTPIRRNHTATHILHWALREVLGDQVKQQGSRGRPDRLRFDFSHFEPLDPDEIVAIEDLANREILGNAQRRPPRDDEVRGPGVGCDRLLRRQVRRRGPSTRAGATRSSSAVALMSVPWATSVRQDRQREQSIGSNLRRIEAISGTTPIERLRAEEATIEQAASLLGVPVDDVLGAIQRRAAEIKELRNEAKALRRNEALGASRSLAAQAVDGVIIARVDDIDRGDLRELAVAVRDADGVQAVVLGGAPSSGGVALVAAVVDGSGYHASDLLAEPASMVGGGGGKDPLLAMAGGKDVSAIDAALDHVRGQLVAAG